MVREEISGKSVYSFESHNVAFEAWAQIKRIHPGDLILISLDHHTDTLLAFQRSTFVPNREEHLPIIAERVAQIDLQNDEHIKQAVADLKNDEQIDAAVQAGIFRYAFCFNNQHKNTHSLEQDAFSVNGNLLSLTSVPSSTSQTATANSSKTPPRPSFEEAVM